MWWQAVRKLAFAFGASRRVRFFFSATRCLGFGTHLSARQKAGSRKKKRLSGDCQCLFTGSVLDQTPNDVSDAHHGHRRNWYGRGLPRGMGNSCHRSRILSCTNSPQGTWPVHYAPATPFLGEATYNFLVKFQVPLATLTCIDYSGCVMLCHVRVV